MNAVVAPPFPANPTVGQIFGGWCWNGSTWVPAPPTMGMTVNTVIFNVSGAYMPSAGLTTCVVECIGGGGGGGGVNSTSAGQNAVAGGGSSGGYARKTLPAALVLGGVVVTVGAGGVGAISTATYGGTGGDTSFGALCVAHGGGGGGSVNTGSGATGGMIGQPGIGDFVTAGAHGAAGSSNMAVGTGDLLGGGLGGALFGGNRGPNPIATGTNTPGYQGDPNTGAGGSGAIVYNQTGQSNSGGVGGSGVCIVTEYLWGVSGGGGSGCAPIPITDGSCIGWGPC